MYNPDCDCMSRFDEPCPTCEQENLENGIDRAMAEEDREEELATL